MHAGLMRILANPENFLQLSKSLIRNVLVWFTLRTLQLTAKTLQLSVQHTVTVISQRPCCILALLGLLFIMLPDVHYYLNLYFAHVFVMVLFLLTGYLMLAFTCLITSGDICLLYRPLMTSVLVVCFCTRCTMVPLIHWRQIIWYSNPNPNFNLSSNPNPISTLSRLLQPAIPAFV